MFPERRVGEGDFSGGTERGVFQKYEINFFRQAPTGD